MTYTGSRGSCRNPYGGLINPARFDFVYEVMGVDCFESFRHSGAKLFALTIISHSIADYLFFGIGRNGYHLPENFFSAFEFFYRTRSWDPETWQDAPPIVEMVTNPQTGKKRKQTIIPPPETLRLQCFDKYYEVAELDHYLSMDDFLKYLAVVRRQWVVSNKKQIVEYIDFCRRVKYKSPFGRQLEFVMEDPTFVETLVSPESPDALVDLIRPVLPVPERTHYRYRSKAVGVERPRRTRALPRVAGQMMFKLGEA